MAVYQLDFSESTQQHVLRAKTRLQPTLMDPIDQKDEYFAKRQKDEASESVLSTAQSDPG